METVLSCDWWLKPIESRARNPELGQGHLVVGKVGQHILQGPDFRQGKGGEQE